MNPAAKRLVVCGITHQTSTVEEREPLQIGHDDIAHANVTFVGLPQVQESLIVSTCNRVEFYFVTSRDQNPFEAVVEFYRKFRDFDVKPLRDRFQTKIATHAVDHIFRVAAGIDSMVVGETQIFGQLKEAYASVCAVKSAGKVIHRLFHQAFRVGKQVRTDTEMGKGACSVSSAAIELLRTKFEREERPAILFIGVNQMIKLAATRCRRIHHSRYRFINRTEEKAREFAEKFSGDGYGLDRMADSLLGADAVISCTSSPEPLITPAMLDEAAGKRDGRKLVVLDLAIPRDVEYPKERRSDVEVLDLEDIKDFVRSQKDRREAAIPQAEEIIKQKLQEFNYWWRHVKEQPLYNGTAGRYESIVESELAALLSKCPPDLKQELSLAAQRIADRVARAAAGNPIT